MRGYHINMCVHVSCSECGFTILLIGERNRKWVSQKIQPANFLGIYKLLGKSQRISSEFINYRKWWSNFSRKFKMVKSVEQKWKMKEMLTNLGWLWGGRCPVLQPHPLKELGRNGNLRNFNDFRLPLGGKLRSFSSWTLACLPNCVI